MLKRCAVFGAVLALGLSLYACSQGGDGPTVSSDIPTNSNPAPVASNPKPVTPPATGTPGILVERISSTFDPDRCTDLSQPQHSAKTELVEVAKVTNNTTRDVYAKPAIFHSDKAGCGALDTNPGGILGLMEAENITPGTSKNWTHRFTIPDRACGAYQFDNDAFNGEIRQSTLSNGDGGKVINTGRDCPSCEAFDVVLSVTGEGLTRTVSVTFKGQKASVKAKVDFGDNTSAQVANGGSVSHTWAYGEFVVTATLDADGISCFKSTTVSNKELCRWVSIDPIVKYGEWGECKKPETAASNDVPACSQSRKVYTTPQEQNSCTQEIRLKDTVITSESQPCECKVDVSGACMIRDSSTSIPSFYASDLGKGYAKLGKPGINTISALQTSCTAGDYTTLLSAFCESNAGPVQREVVTYNGAGGYASHDCDDSGCEPIECPGVCIDDPKLTTTLFQTSWQWGAYINPITGYADVKDSGTWNMKILSATYNDSDGSSLGSCGTVNNPDCWVRVNVSQTTVCGETARLQESFDWIGAEGRYWYMIVTRDGVGKFFQIIDRGN